MTVKCYWCGAVEEQTSVYCTECGRKLQWSNFLKAMVKPSIECLLGDERLSRSDNTAERLPVGAA